jgi:hypothetical protein
MCSDDLKAADQMVLGQLNLTIVLGASINLTKVGFFTDADLPTDYQIHQQFSLLVPIFRVLNCDFAVITQMAGQTFREISHFSVSAFALPSSINSTARLSRKSTTPSRM